MSQDKLIASVSGLRGVVGTALQPEGIVRYVAAAAAEFAPGRVLVSRDGRPSGIALARLVEGTLAALGRTVLSGAVLATPTVGVLVSSRRLAGAVQITASHNPAPYNGLKLFDASGRVVAPQVGYRIGQLFQNLSLAQCPWAAHDQIGQLLDLENPHEEHLQRILATVDVERIRACKFRVLLDSNHGAGSGLGIRLLRELSCEVRCLGETPDGQFEHPPEPTAENLAAVASQVPALSADVGFCQDPDADRLALIDEHGRYVGEEYTVALCVMRRLQQRAGPVVINCATSRMTVDLCQQAGVPCLRAPVGEAHVVEAMRKSGAVYGGEGNGGPIDPDVGWVRDSFAGMAQILDLMAVSGKKLSQLAAMLPQYHIVKSKVICPSPQVLDQVLRRLERQWNSTASVDRQDGVRWDWEDKWVLVRGSNTEPIVRVIAEARSREQANQLCEVVVRAFEERS
ncbi:MAG: phosphoglucosamine mutase [Pirellulaceae bacterium]|nr:MAG: phosphoglucosamine mutase [Pirellulaceae bacterium]